MTDKLLLQIKRHQAEFEKTVPGSPAYFRKQKIVRDLERVWHKKGDELNDVIEARTAKKPVMSSYMKQVFPYQRKVYPPYQHVLPQPFNKHQAAINAAKKALAQQIAFNKAKAKQKLAWTKHQQKFKLGRFNPNYKPLKRVINVYPQNYRQASQPLSWVEKRTGHRPADEEQCLDCWKPLSRCNCAPIPIKKLWKVPQKWVKGMRCHGCGFDIDQCDC